MHLLTQPPAINTLTLRGLVLHPLNWKAHQPHLKLRKSQLSQPALTVRQLLGVSAGLHYLSAALAQRSSRFPKSQKHGDAFSPDPIGGPACRLSHQMDVALHCLVLVSTLASLP